MGFGGRRCHDQGRVDLATGPRHDALGVCRFSAIGGFALNGGTCASVGHFCDCLNRQSTVFDYVGLNRTALCASTLVKRTVLGFFTGDITVALFMNRFPQMWSSAAEEREQRDFLKGLVVPNWFVWQITSIIGILLGSQVPTHWGLGFAGTLAILCVMLPLVQNRPAVGGVVLASVVAVLAHSLPYKLGLLLAVILGMGFAMWLEEHMRLLTR